MNDSLYLKEMSNELKALENDRISTSTELKVSQQKYAELIKSTIGKDIDDVLEGKTYVKISWKEKISRFLDKLFDVL